MKGSPEEEVGKGKIDKYGFLKELHKKVNPLLYLEIGVQKGRSLNLAKCKAIGVDPHPKVTTHHQIYKETSDEFFNRNLYIAPDLVFIDGLHIFEQALKDFINVERISHENTVVVIDDVAPAHPSQALRERKTQKWTGDVWKLYSVLLKYRPDLKITFHDVFPTGVIVVSGMDKTNHYLSDNYHSIVKEFINLNVPRSVINRKSWDKDGI